MKIITSAIKLSNYEYYIKHLEIINIILPIEKFPEKLTNKEIAVLAAFMCQDKSLIEEDMFNGVVRKKVMEKLIMKPGGLGNHLKSMIKKNFLIKNDLTKRIKIGSFLIPEINNQGYRIKILKQ